MATVTPLPPTAKSTAERMFPRLTLTQVARVAAHGRTRTVQQGEVLFDTGDAAAPFLLVVAGQIEAIRHTPEGEQLVAVHEPGQFTGEVSLLSGRRALVSARAAVAGEVIELSRENLLALVQTDAEISEILMRAFILRRVELIARGIGDAIVIGSAHCAATLRCEGVPHAQRASLYVHRPGSRDGRAGAARSFPRDRSGRAHRRVPWRHRSASSFDCGDRRLPRLQCHRRSGAGTRSRRRGQRSRRPRGGGVCRVGGSRRSGARDPSPGGQAGSSSKIENYLGFPTGISGQALAGRAYTQAQKFGAQVLIAKSAVRLQCQRTPATAIDIGESAPIRARTVVVATGAEYRKPLLARSAAFRWRGRVLRRHVHGSATVRR